MFVAAVDERKPLSFPTIVVGGFSFNIPHTSGECDVFQITLYNKNFFLCCENHNYSTTPSTESTISPNNWQINKYFIARQTCTVANFSTVCYGAWFFFGILGK